MGFFRRLRTGWALSMDALRVVRREPSLALFPLLAAVAGAVYLGLVVGGAVLLTGPDPGPGAYAGLFVGYLGSSFLAAFFAAALMHNAYQVFEGRDPTVRHGLAAAWRHRRQLFVWALVSAVVGVLLRALESSDTPLADVAAFLFSVSWGILTYFVVPVIVFEDVDTGEMFSRSGETFRRTWGETAGAGFGVGIVTVLFTLAGIAIAVAVFLLLGGSGLGLAGGLAVAVVVALLAFLLGNTLTSVAKTALYVYATEGRRPDGFEDVDFSTAAR